MQVFHKAQDFSGSASAVAIGNFDGIHLGHARLLAHLFEKAKQRGASSTVLTFYPHPSEVLRPGTKLPRLMTTTEKLAKLESLGLDYTVVQPFDYALSQLTAEAFFEEVLVKSLRAKSIIIGFNFTFGKGRQGNTEVLKALCGKYGIDLHIEPPFQFENENVSSSLIRQRIAAGDMEGASKLLGRPYLLAGPVKHGDKRGTSLGFPTANVRVPEEKVLPANGVYVTRAIWQRQSFLSVTNIGVRPTFTQGVNAPSIETHLLDFSSPLYDEFLQLEFLGRLREEKRFSSKEALIAQIQADISAARSLEKKWKSLTS